MIRKLLIILASLVLGAAALLTARYLDATPRIPESQPSLQTAPQASLPDYLSTEPAETSEAAGETVATVPQETESPQQDRFVLTFAGDCTLGCHTAHVKAGYGFPAVVGEDYGYPFRNVAEYFLQDDFTMVNLEGALTQRGTPKGARYSFRGPESYVNILLEGSVEAVTIANNHINDFGAEGAEDTRKTLDEAAIPYVERDSRTLIELDSGLTIGLYGAVYYKFDPQDMVSEIAQLREAGADIVIFAPHWGVEGSYRPNEEQTSLAHQAIDAGADIVFGTHPHVLQPIEEYNGGVIYYSLGNFSFGGNIYPDDPDTVVLQQEILRGEDGSFTLGQRTLIPCCLTSSDERNNFQPTPYPEGSEAYIRTLSKLDGTYRGMNWPVD